VDKEVVAIPLADDAEIVDERLFNSYLGIELILRDASSLVLITSRLADSCGDSKKTFTFGASLGSCWCTLSAFVGFDATSNPRKLRR
jgi:hypothetical protein